MRFVYGERETMLYALSVGMGQDPLDARELPFVYEGAGLRAVPTMAVVLASTGIIRRLGIDFAKILHGEQRLTLHRQLPVAGELLANSRVSAVYDKGAGKGAVLLLETTARLAADDLPLFSFVMTIMARGDGGFGGPQGSGPEPHQLPDRPPDHIKAFKSRPEAALLYRLNGDRNSLHADPKAASRAGFDRPILHGLATYGIACRALLRGACDYDSGRMRSFDARFSAPVYPGDEIVTDIWRDGDTVSFRCRVPARDAVVLNNGRCLLGSAP
ncbi:MAG: MaoC family dehydratase N-terminal domain-containing protein [Bradyrhizobium sp.]|nr:MaoC family dehydratase N-terminal domain-containing protein [Bradyrhizobium sp.]